MPDEEPTLPHTVETDRNALANTTAAAAALAKLSEALDAAASLQECDSIQKQADALKSMLKIARADLQWQNKFFALRIKAMRRWGEIYSSMEKNKGGDPLRVEEGGQTLAQMGVSYNFSSECQKLAKLPLAVFNEYLALGEVADDRNDDELQVVELTKKGLFDHAEEADRKASPKDGDGDPASAPLKPPKPGRKPPPEPEGIDAEVVNGITKILDGREPKRSKKDAALIVDWQMTDLMVRAWFNGSYKDVRVDEHRETKPKAEAIRALCESFGVDDFEEPVVQIETNPDAGTIELTAWAATKDDRTVLSSDGSNPPGANLFTVDFWDDIEADWQRLGEFQDFERAKDFAENIEEWHYTEWAKAEAFANELLGEMADKGLPTPDTDEGEGDEDADEQKARAICERLGMDDDDIDDPTVRAAILELGEHDAAIMQSLIQDHDGKTLGVAFYALCTISDPLLDMADYPYEREHKEPYLDLKKAALR